VARIRSSLVRALEWGLIGAFSLLTLDVLWGVFSRYVLGHQSRFTEELAIYLLVWISLLGASLTYGEKGHLGVDYFVSKLDPSAQRLVAVAVEVLVVAFAAFALAFGGFVLVQDTLASGQVSPSLGVQMGFVYMAVPICGAFFVLFGVEHLIALLRSPSRD
jgi:TRAP-type C4-dicarboxylate transport system permease small subunit